MSPKKCQNSDTEGSSAIPDTRIEDGKLLFEKRWCENLVEYLFPKIRIILILGIIEDNLFLSKEGKWQNFQLLYLPLATKL